MGFWGWVGFARGCRGRVFGGVLRIISWVWAEGVMWGLFEIRTIAWFSKEIVGREVRRARVGACASKFRSTLDSWCDGSVTFWCR